MPGMMNYQISQNIKILLFSPTLRLGKISTFGPILNFYNLWFSRLI